MTPPSSLVVGDYKTINPGELESYADNHKGEKVKVVLTITHFATGTENKEFQGMIAGNDAQIFVDLVNSASGIYVGDTITIYGVVYGNYSYVSIIGVSVSEPKIIDAFYKKP